VGVGACWVLGCFFVCLVGCLGFVLLLTESKIFCFCD
jgi:hypothetical protein